MADQTETGAGLGAGAAARVEVVAVDEQRVVVVNGHLIARYRCDDRGTERVVMTQLSEVLALPDRAIAAAFGMHPVSLSRLRRQAQQGGAAALLPRRTGPTKPSKLTPPVRARIKRLRTREGLSTRAIAAQLARGGRPISFSAVAAVLRDEGAAAPTVRLPLDERGAAVGEAPRPVAVGEARTSRYAGALLLYAGLARLGLWEVLHKLGGRVGAWRQFDGVRIAALTVLCFALRFRSIEDVKNGARRDLGVLIGTAAAPSVQTLRRKLVALTESLEPQALTRALFRRYVELEPVWEGLYYVDGHFCPYYGGVPTPQGWHPQRRLAAPGHTDVYVHDARGRVLFFLSQPLNDSLVRALPRMVEEIRAVHGAGAFTLVFDRGGYSGPLFRWLTAQGIGFITYLKGRKATRHYPVARFQAGWFRFEGTRHVYRVFEKRTRVGRAGLVRTLVMRGNDGAQIPVLTNLAPAVKPARIVHCLRLRWRQENTLKYLKHHYAIDQILQYGADVEPAAARPVKNPARRRLQARIAAVEAEIAALEAELGRGVDTSSATTHPTTRGLKIAFTRQRQQLAKRREVLSRLLNRLRHTPSRIDAAARPDAPFRMLLREDRRLVVNALKVAGANAERLLAVQFNRHYRQAKDVCSVFRSLLHLPGTVTHVSPERIEVHLESPHPRKRARAVAALLDELNDEAPRMFGTGPVLQFYLTG